MPIFRPWEDQVPSSTKLSTSISDEALEIIVVDDEMDFSASSSSSSSFSLTPISSNSSDGEHSLESPRTQNNRQCTRCECPNCLNGKDRSPTGIRVHVCHYNGCTKKYRKTSHLRAHLRSHEGWKPFVCTFHGCDRAFGRSDQLQRHMRAHTGERKHLCEHCQRRFARSDHLRQHIARQHLQAVPAKPFTHPPVPAQPIFYQIPHFYPHPHQIFNPNWNSRIFLSPFPTITIQAL
ncbi:unnamed protein product, partial [Mesorhabditis belari]|uniref:C2H2-type domain-containing protein n=1 Tax=Mesorhabditis belari TaxID=2138241 RepID=A0AAF3FGS2_9BILA